MNTCQQIKGILLDSGDTLVRPKAGSWWPGSRIRRIVEESGIRNLAWNKMEEALQQGMDYLDANHHILTEEEERDQFMTYYAIILRALGLARPPDQLTRNLVEALGDDVGVEPFPETRSVLESLQERNFRLGIISNAWPSLDRMYRELGFLDFFEVFVIASQIGCCKPDERIFLTAIRQMELPPEDLLFVDDWPGYVQKANEMGMKGVLIDRNGENTHTPGMNRIESLDQLVESLDHQ